MGQEMSFSTTKDRVFQGYETVSSWLARRSGPVRRTVYGILGGLFWVAYLLPGGSVRPTMVSLARLTGERSKAALFRRFVKRFFSGTDLAERVRHGYASDLDGMLDIKDRAAFDALVARGGLFLALPHLHASLAMCRCLSQSYPVLVVVSLTRNEARAAAQRALYAQVGCEFLDVRSEEPATVARRILKALKSGMIVAGTVDRIQKAPEEPIDKAKDIVRVTAFGEPVGYGAWPTRFATKARAPIVPAVVEQVPGKVRLICGQAVTPTPDLVATTQEWVSEIEALVRQHPDEWAFCLDKHWAGVLQRAASED